MNPGTSFPRSQPGTFSAAGLEGVHDNEADIDEDRLLRASEVQRELGISRATAYRMMTDGTLPTYRFGGRNGRRAMVRVSQKELRAWMLARRVTGQTDSRPADSLLTSGSMLPDVTV